MPEMFEIYQSHASRYHELILAEDFENNLGYLLNQLINWHGLNVLEVGVGTGRVTQLYIPKSASAVCCDQSPHMLEFAKKSLAAHSPKLTFKIADNTTLPEFGYTFDVFIEGWSFGHTIMDCGNEQEILHTTNVLLSNAMKNLSSGSTMFIIETLGTNTNSPIPPHKNLRLFYETLVHVHHFNQHVIRTDYQFGSNDEAADKMGFFFGEDMKRSVLARGTSEIPEWTGVWMKEI